MDLDEAAFPGRHQREATRYRHQSVESSQEAPPSPLFSRQSSRGRAQGANSEESFLRNPLDMSPLMHIYTQDVLELHQRKRGSGRAPSAADLAQSRDQLEQRR